MKPTVRARLTIGLLALVSVGSVASIVILAILGSRVTHWNAPMKTMFSARDAAVHHAA